MLIMRLGLCNLPILYRRINQVQNSVAKSGHPLSKFHCGNLQTLLDKPKENGIDIRQR